MVGAIIEVMVFNLDESFLTKCFNEEIKTNIAIAPAEGLMLNKVGYDVYNERLDEWEIDRPKIEP